jgi:glycosyltransferase involved in cell wall biosynthesis
MTCFSLIVATIHRTAELKRLLASLVDQSEEIEVLIVDQNPDDRLEGIVKAFQRKLRIHHLSSAKGIARARNVALSVATGDIVAFPDDDCWYPPGLLMQVRKTLASRPEYDGITGRGADTNGDQSGVRWLKRPATINRFNIWRASIEYTVFLRRRAVSGLRFNEELGLGSNTPWGAGEGTDYLLRTINRGHKIRYDPSIVIHHPSNARNPPSEEKLLNYARGTGRVMGLNGYSPALAAILCLGPLVRMGIGLARFDFKAAALARKAAFSRLAGYRAEL